jgi:hypothetical protein
MLNFFDVKHKNVILIQNAACSCLYCEQVSHWTRAHACRESAPHIHCLASTMPILDKEGY